MDAKSADSRRRKLMEHHVGNIDIQPDRTAPYGHINSREAQERCCTAFWLQHAGRTAAGRRSCFCAEKMRKCYALGILRYGYVGQPEIEHCRAHNGGVTPENGAELLT